MVERTPLSLTAGHGEDVRERPVLSSEMVGRRFRIARLEALPGGLAESTFGASWTASLLVFFSKSSVKRHREEDKAAGAEAEGEEEDGEN